MTSPRPNRSGYFQLAADLVRSSFMPGQRVLVPGAGNVQLAATVVMMFNGSRKPVLVQVDGDRPEKYEAHAVEDVRPFADRDTRPADTMAAEVYWPSECPVCERPSVQGSVYCGPECERIMTGRPSMQEQALEM